MVVHVELAGLFLPELFQRVGPQDVAHDAVGRGFSEPIDALDVFEGVEFWT